MGETRLLTARLDLRPLPAAAARALPDNREAAAQALEAELSPEWPQPDLLDLLRTQTAAAPGDPRFGVWVVVERESGAVVGDIGFVAPPDETGSVEIGYSVVRERRRRGYASEATRAMVEWALGQPDVSVVVAGCGKDNVPSIRILERVGFVRTGETDGEIRWRYTGGTS